MALTIEIKINGELVAGAVVVNTSSLADLSNYEVEAVEQEAPHLGIPALHTEFQIEQHERRQSVWELVAKVAEGAAAASRAGL